MAKPKKTGSAAQDGGGFSRVFGDVANKTSQAAGRASTFILAAGVILVWAITGPLFGFSDTWQFGHQHRHNHRNILDGFSNPELAKQG
jgi:hypothetical protein